MFTPQNVIWQTFLYLETSNTRIDKTTLYEILISAQIHLFTSGNFNYYKVKVADGTQMVEGSVLKTCQEAGLIPVCPGSSTCRQSTPECFITPLVTNGCTYSEGFLSSVSEHLCELPPYQCPPINNMFVYSYGWNPYQGVPQEVGVVGPNYPAHGRQYTSEDEGQHYYAFCVRCGECQGSLCNNYKS